MGRSGSNARRWLWVGALGVVGVAAILVVALGRRPEGNGAAPWRSGAALRTLLEPHPEGRILSAADSKTDADPTLVALGDALAALRAGPETSAIVADYPQSGSVFPCDIVAPTILWHDDEEAGAWLAEFDFADGAPPLRVLVPGAPPVSGKVDREALGPTNEVYRPTAYQRSARSWTPPERVWEEFKRRSRGKPARFVLRGVDSTKPARIVSEIVLSLATSEDPVGAPIFYRDVPLMPQLGDKGIINPLDLNAIPLIQWRLRDVSRPESKVVLEAMPSCANCHSFSTDGATMGMDVDGPQGDKGTYAIAPVAPEMTIDPQHVITWNSFPDKPAGHKTIGFLTRVSPDGKFVVSTVNEALFVSNFANYRFLQVFYPTRGILAWYSTETKEMRALPGADDPAYVHCNPVWTPDGKTLVFSRAEAFDPYEAGRPLAVEPNDPNEPRIRYGLYRIPFDGGRGGTPQAIEGASHNGMSNTFPKVSPDGKWIVFTKCKNGQLMRPDGKLWIVPLEGGRAREMRCNTDLMNSWHSFSPNGRWLVFSSKANTPYTQMFLTHLDDEGNATPPILIPNSTAANRAVNLPEFLNVAYDGLDRIEVPAVNHHRQLQEGIERLDAHDVEGALPFLRKAVELEPDFGLAHANLGSALSHRGDLDDAARHLRRALELHPESAFAWNSLGWVRGRQGQWPEALEHFRRALEISPRSPYGHNNVGLARRALGRPKLALEAFRKATELDPGFADAWKNLGYALLQDGRFAEAVGPYRRAVEIDGGDRVALSSLGHALLKAGQTAEAIRILGRLTELAPDDVPTLLSLAWQLATHADASIRDGPRAAELARRACDLSKQENPTAYDVLAAALAEAGRFPEALGAIQTARRLARDGRGPLVDGVEAREALYRSGKPFHRPREPRR